MTASHKSIDLKIGNPARWMGQNPAISSSKKYLNPWQFGAPSVVARSAYAQLVKEQMGLHFPSGQGTGKQSRADDADACDDKVGQ